MQKIRIDFDNPGLPQHISAVENDSQSRFFQATLYENGKAYTAPEGATYSIMYRGFGPQNQGWYDTINDGAGKRAACAVSGNVVTCEIARQALQVPGHVSIVLCVTTGKGYMLKSWPIECDCKNDRYDSTAEIQSFFYITQVSNADWTQAIQAVEELKNTIDPTLSLSGKAADAAKVGEAVGKVEEDIDDVDELLFSGVDTVKSKNGFIDNQFNVKNSTGWNHVFVPLELVADGVKIRKTGNNLRGYSNKVPAYAFYDKDKALINAEYGVYYSKVIYIPENAYYMMCNSSDGEFELKFESVIKKINNASRIAKDQYVECTGEEITGYGLYGSGSLYQNQNSKIRRIKLKKGFSYCFDFKTSFLLSDFEVSSVNSNASKNKDMSSIDFENLTDYKYMYFDSVNAGNDLRRKVYVKKVQTFSYKEMLISGTGKGLFTFDAIPVRKGDIVTVKRNINSEASNALYFSNVKRTDSTIEAVGIHFTENIVELIAENDWNGFTSWSDDETGYEYSYEITVKHKLNDSQSQLRVGNSVIVSAKNSSIEDKMLSDFVCDGVNDEVQIKQAIDIVKFKNGSVILCDGDYFIDKFDDYTINGMSEKVAICLHNDTKKSGGVSIEGASKGKPCRTIIHVNERAFNDVGEKVPSIFGGGNIGTGYHGGFGFNLSNVSIEIPNSNNPCIAVNYQHLYWGIINECDLSVIGFGQDVIPCENLIGLRGWAGWSDGRIIGVYDVYAKGFRVGFQLGGEHVICERLGTRYCYTAYSFGEYPLDFGSGAQVHPITLINCCDEHSATLPKFYNSGNADSRNAGRCQVDFIGFNIEYYPLITGTPIIGAMEEINGGWVGRIEYTVENNENNSDVSLPFWADGHGKNFRTLNMAQCQIGTTALRNTFSPNYMQQYFDTDLNRVVYCKEPSTKTWIDSNGNIV